jgi:UDP-N-acetylglucosamine 4,6-dehydratase
MKNLISKNDNILIFGGSGFLGLELLRILSKEYKNITIFGRDEGKLISAKQQFPHVKIITGDVSDKFEVHQAMRNQDCVFHLAAFKHVGMAQTFTRECIKTNVIGSFNILDCSLEFKPKFVVTTSTDKAAKITGVYGATKYIVEELFTQYNNCNRATTYRVVRYGNVLYSTGSVLCKWKKLISENKEVIITDPSATRFFWTVSEAVNLIFECLEKATDPSPYCPNMKSMTMGDLLEAMILKYSVQGARPPVRTIGLQVGENLHEKILADGPSSHEAERFTIEEIMELI